VLTEMIFYFLIRANLQLYIKPMKSVHKYFYISLLIFIAGGIFYLTTALFAHSSRNALQAAAAQETPTSQVAPTAIWDPAYGYRRALRILAHRPLSATTVIKVEGMDFSQFITSTKALPNHNDIRIVYWDRGKAQWKEVSRAYYTHRDIEFQLVEALPAGLNYDYYLFYGNPNADGPPLMELAQGWSVEMYDGKGALEEDYVETVIVEGHPMNFDDICEEPIDHDGRVGHDSEQSNRFTGRLFVPASGQWTFYFYTATDTYDLTISGSSVYSHTVSEGPAWQEMNSIFLHAGWHEMKLLNSWDACGPWKLEMAGPDHPRQLVPANYFQQVTWARNGVLPLDEEDLLSTPTPTITSTPTPTGTPTQTPTPTNTATPDHLEPNNSPGQSTELSHKISQTHSLQPVGDEDWYSIDLNASSGITLEVTGDGVENMAFTLYDSGVNSIAFGESSDQEPAMRLIRECNINPLSQGGYYVKLDGVAPDRTVDSYEIRLVVAECAAATPTPTPTLPPGADAFEHNDTCEQAKFISPAGFAQAHTFHDPGDVDWLSFRAYSAGRYRIRATVPRNSKAHLVAAYYKTCGDQSIDKWNTTIRPDAQFDIFAQKDETIYLQMQHQNVEEGGDEFQYNVLVEYLDAPPPEHAVILVAGRLSKVDIVQPIIDNTAVKMYQYFRGHGVQQENALFLATDTFESNTSDLPGYNNLITNDILKSAIINWTANLWADSAESDLSIEESDIISKMLTLYLIDHGHPDILYLDQVNGHQLSPSMLDGWLTTLEEVVPNIAINVIIESCNAGSFISAEPQAFDSISKAGRVIITSSSDSYDARVSSEGAYFTEHLRQKLKRGWSLGESFSSTKTIIDEMFDGEQAPWIDANGNRIPNEPEDKAIANQIYFVSSTPIGFLSEEDFPPYIVGLSHQSSITVTNNTGILEVIVRDEEMPDEIPAVWAAVYPPFSQLQAKSNGELNAEDEFMERVALTYVGDHLFTAPYHKFCEQGTYRVILHAEDPDELSAEPMLFNIFSGSSCQTFLPVISR